MKKAFYLILTASATLIVAIILFSDPSGGSQEVKAKVSTDSLVNRFP